MDELSSISRKKCVDCHAKFAAIAAAGQQQAFDVMTTPTGLGWERNLAASPRPTAAGLERLLIN